MKLIKKLLFLVLCVLTFQLTFAQRPPGGQRGQRPDPSQMAKMEKTMVLDSISNLTNDQKSSIDKIYGDYEKSVKEVMAASATNRDGIREKMQKVRAAKDSSLEKVLTKEQMAKFKELMKSNRGRGSRGQGQGRPGQGRRGG